MVTFLKNKLNDLLSGDFAMLIFQHWLELKNSRFGLFVARELDQLKQILIAFDQLIGTIIGLFIVRKCWADETVSSMAYRLNEESKGWYVAYRLFNGFFFWQEDHCRQSFLNEINRRQSPPELRKAK